MTRKYIAVFVLLVLSFHVSGCATIITGPYQKVPVTSEPTGAVVSVDGKEATSTPCKVRLKRNKDHLLALTMNGYKKEEVKLTHVLSGAICGNAVLFGIAGLAADNLSGAQFKLMPEKVHVELRKE